MKDRNETQIRRWDQEDDHPRQERYHNLWYRIRKNYQTKKGTKKQLMVNLSRTISSRINYRRSSSSYRRSNQRSRRRSYRRSSRNNYSRSRRSSKLIPQASVIWTENLRRGTVATQRRTSFLRLIRRHRPQLYYDD